MFTGRQFNNPLSDDEDDDCVIVDDHNKENVFKIGSEVTVSRIPTRMWRAYGNNVRNARPSVRVPRRPYMQKPLIPASTTRFIANSLNEEAKRKRRHEESNYNFELCETKNQFHITERRIVRQIRELKKVTIAAIHFIVHSDNGDYFSTIPKRTKLKYPSMQVLRKPEGIAFSTIYEDDDPLSPYVIHLIIDIDLLAKIGLMFPEYEPFDGQQMNKELSHSVVKVAETFAAIHATWPALWEIGTELDLKPETIDDIFTSLQRCVYKELKTLISNEELKRAVSLLNMWYLRQVADRLRKKHISNVQRWYFNRFNYMKQGVACKFFCDYCALVFVEELVYEQHRREHLDAIQYKCEECQVGFLICDAFEDHLFHFHNDSDDSGPSTFSDFDRPINSVDPLAVDSDRPTASVRPFTGVRPIDSACPFDSVNLFALDRNHPFADDSPFTNFFPTIGSDRLSDSFDPFADVRRFDSDRPIDSVNLFPLDTNHPFADDSPFTNFFPPIGSDRLFDSFDPFADVRRFDSDRPIDSVNLFPLDSNHPFADDSPFTNFFPPIGSDRLFDSFDPFADVGRFDSDRPIDSVNLFPLDSNHPFADDSPFTNFFPPIGSDRLSDSFDPFADVRRFDSDRPIDSVNLFPLDSNHPFADDSPFTNFFPPIGSDRLSDSFDPFADVRPFDSDRPIDSVNLFPLDSNHPIDSVDPIAIDSNHPIASVSPFTGVRPIDSDRSIDNSYPIDSDDSDCDDLDLGRNDKKTATVMECNTCRMPFTDKNEFREHCKEHLVTKWDCAICHASFNTL